jgi:hypothetical protein
MNFTLSSATAEADKYYYEDHKTAGGWESVEHNSDGINYLISKHYLKTKDGADIFVTKCNMTVKTSTQDLLNTYLNGQGTWDFSSTSSVLSIGNNGGNEIMYAQHKVLSAASVKKDCVFERTVVNVNNGVKVYATSVTHQSRPEKYQGYGRSFILFNGCYILETNPGVCDFTFVHCYDFNGWIHDKFILAEKAKTAARMNKIVRGTKNAVIVPVTNPLIIQTNSNSNKPAQSSYAEYNQLIRDAQPVYTPEPSNPHQSSRPLYEPIHATNPQLQNLQPVNTSSSTGPNFCPSCGGASKGMRFCAGCGHKLF